MSTGGWIIGYDATIEPDFSRGWQEILTAGADNRQVQSRVTGPLLLPYVVSFVPESWRILKYLLTIAEGGGGGPTYTHTFTVGNTVESFILEWARRHTTDHVITLIGNVIQSLTINFTKSTGEGTEGLVRVTARCFAKDESEGSSVTTLDNGNLDRVPFKFHHVKVTIGGTEFEEVNNGEITFEAGIDHADSRYCSSTYGDTIGDPIPKTFRITGRININITDKTMYDDWAAGIVVAGTNSLEINEDVANDDNKLVISLSNFRIHGGVPPTNLEGVTNVDVVWTAEGLTSCVVTDTISSY